jgi:hypothetical protein
MRAVSGPVAATLPPRDLGAYSEPLHPIGDHEEVTPMDLEPRTDMESHDLYTAAQLLDCLAEALPVADDPVAVARITKRHTPQWHACHMQLLIGWTLADLRSNQVSVELVRHLAKRYRDRADTQYP